MADPQARIFISYRREDSAGHVLALLPALRRHFGDRVFKDTDNIPPGEDFVRFIKSELDSCSVLLAVIGRDWLNVQDPRLKTRRLDNPDDFLRIEVATALRSERIRVIPLLVERSTMPSAAELPPDLAELSQRNALELSDVRWESDVQILIQAIQRAIVAPVEPTDATPQRPELLDLHKRRAREITAHLADARKAVDAQDYEGTLLSCEKALLLDPKGIEALDMLDRARKALDEQKIETWLKEARQSLRQGDIGGASDVIDQALSIDPASETALGLRKEMLAVRRERERARGRARAAVAATQRARTSLDEEDFDSAVGHADDALALEPQSADAQDVRSRAVAALDERRRLREGRRRAHQAVTDPPEERSAAAEPAEAERERERASEARERYAVPELRSNRRYIVIGAAAAVILSSTIGLWLYQQLSEPTPVLETNQASSPPVPAGATGPPPTAGGFSRGASPGPVVTPTTLAKEEGRLGTNSAVKNPAKPPAPPSNRPLRGAGEFGRGASPGPVATPTAPPGEDAGRGENRVVPNPTTPPDPGSSRSSAGVNPFQMKADFDKGVAASQAGKYDEAIARFEAAATSFPNCDACYYNIGVAQMRKKDYGKAEASFKHALELKPDSVRYFTALADAYSRQGKFDQAAEMGKKLLESSGGAAGGNFNAVYNHGVGFYNAGKMAEAHAQFEAALKINPNHAEARYLLGMTKMSQGKMTEAATEFETYLKLVPAGPRAEEVKAILASGILKK